MWALLTEKFRWEPLGGPKKNMQDGWVDGWFGRYLMMLSDAFII